MLHSRTFGTSVLSLENVNGYVGWLSDTNVCVSETHVLSLITFHVVLFPLIITLVHVHSLMVSQVNQYLDDLAMSNTKKDRPGMRKALQLLLRNTSALEQK